MPKLNKVKRFSVSNLIDVIFKLADAMRELFYF